VIAIAAGGRGTRVPPARCSLCLREGSLPDGGDVCGSGQRLAKEVSPHIELQIYDGFWPKTDEFLMESFHALPWEKRLAIAEKFQDPRLKTIAIHLIHIERPELLEMLISAAHDPPSGAKFKGHGVRRLNPTPKTGGYVWEQD
jgi:hypothetical protein